MVLRLNAPNISNPLAEIVFAGKLDIDYLSIILAPEFLPIALAGKSRFDTLLLAWFQIESVLLDILDDILLLHLPLETA
jgi:hypothetical protein